MTQEEKQLLLKDLCVRLPYKVKVKSSRRQIVVTLSLDIMTDFHLGCIVKPYLRPMSSMTKDERREYDKLIAKCIYDPEAYFFANYDRLYNWLLSHYFDFRGLIEKGLALKAPEGMYKLK